MTDPQNDKPCRDCKRPTQHATEICDDCRTPAGRLLTELAALGIPGEAIEEQHVNMNSSTTVGVGCLTIEVDGDGRWTIDADDSDGVTAANAIAAIVQAPGLRLNIPREQYAEDVLQAFSDGCDFGGAAMNQWFGHAFDVGDGSGPDFDAAAMWRDRVAKRVAGSSTTTARAETAERDLCLVTTERDTLAARVAALEAHNGRMVAAWLDVADACDRARRTHGSKWGEGDGAQDVACSLPGDTWAETGPAIRDLANNLPPIHDEAAALRDLAGGAS